MAGPLQPGDQAPDFDLPATAAARCGWPTSRARSLVLYFYPKDDTPGCTTEAQDFTAAGRRVRQGRRARWSGSPRTASKRHDKFTAKYGLDVPLGSDAEGDDGRAYGAWVEKSLYGRKYMGIDRSTFLIDRTGVIRAGLAQGEGARPRPGGAGSRSKSSARGRGCTASAAIAERLRHDANPVTGLRVRLPDTLPTAYRRRVEFRGLSSRRFHRCAPLLLE